MNTQDESSAELLLTIQMKAEGGRYSVTISDGDHGEVHYSPTVSDACRVINSYLAYHTLAVAIGYTPS